MIIGHHRATSRMPRLGPRTMTDGAGSQTRTYDDLDRLTAVTRGSRTFAYAYDPASNLVSRTYPDSTVTTATYDDDGRLASAAVGSATTTYGYDAAGNVTTIVTPDGYTARYAYDRAGRLLEVAHRTDTQLLSRFTYALDPAGNRTAVTSRLGTVSYRYDELNRLTGACWDTTCPWGAGASAASCLDCGSATGVTRPADPTPPDPADTFSTWTYDPVGNRTSETTHLGTTTSAYDAADRLTSVIPPGASAIPYTYDDNGNQLSAGTDIFAWDAADRMVSATANGTSETYTYAGDGRRLSVTATGATTSWEWDLAHGLPMLAIERDAAGAVTRRSTYGLGRIATSVGSATAYHHADGLGSAVDLTDPSGDPVAWAEYQPFGAVRTSGLATGAPAVPFGFTGEFGDPTGLVHLRARQYDPLTGRFLSTDPVAPSLTDPHLGTYAYVRNAPTVGSDPSGLCWPICFAAVGAAVGGVIGGVAYAATNVTTFDGREALGAVAGGAVAGAVTAVAGPLGGSAASGLGFAAGGIVAGGIVAGAATTAISAIGGVAATHVESLVGRGRAASGMELFRGAFFNGLGGYLGSYAYRYIGIFMARQAALFGPHSWSALARGVIGGARNSRAILYQSLTSSAFGSAGYLRDRDVK